MTKSDIIEKHKSMQKDLHMLLEKPKDVDLIRGQLTSRTKPATWSSRTTRRFLKLGNQMQSVPVDVRVKANSMLKAKTMTSITGEVRGVGRVKAAPKRVSSKYRQGTFLQRSQMKPFGRTANARGQPHMVQHPDPT